jgi:hypothetical protein
MPPVQVNRVYDVSLMIVVRPSVASSVSASVPPVMTVSVAVCLAMRMVVTFGVAVRSAV